MTERTAARRYARALFDVAMNEHADVSALEPQLAQFSNLIAGHAGLSQALLNPVVPAPRKHAAVQELVGRLQLAPIVSKLLVVLAKHDRLVLLPHIVEAYRERLREHQNVIRAEVTTAMPLGPQHTQEIEQQLARATGCTVQLSTRVDPSIVGGVVARIGDVVYDGSITNHLERMKQRLIEQG